MEKTKKSLYAILEVDKQASQDQIKTAYKKLALVSSTISDLSRNGIPTNTKKKTVIGLQRSSK